MKTPGVLECLLIIFISLTILKFTSPSETIISNILRIAASAGGGGLLTITITNAATRKRADHAYRAIIAHLCQLSENIYANFKHGGFSWTYTDKEDSIMSNLFFGAYGAIDASREIENVESLLHTKANGMSDEEVYDMPYKPKIIYGIKDLVNIYFRDGINNTNDKTILEQLYHGTSSGLQLIGSLEGWGGAPSGALTKDQLQLIGFFLQTCLPLYRSLLKERDIPIIERDGRIERERKAPHA